jgi:hypothetical protein
MDRVLHSTPSEMEGFFFFCTLKHQQANFHLISNDGDKKTKYHSVC